jgi:hypothetical protein
MALELAPPPASAIESLRAAFATLDIARRLTFEQAMANRAYSIGIRNLAEACARRRRRRGLGGCL